MSAWDHPVPEPRRLPYSSASTIYETLPSIHVPAILDRKWQQTVDFGRGLTIEFRYRDGWQSTMRLHLPAGTMWLKERYQGDDLEGLIERVRQHLVWGEQVIWQLAWQTTRVAMPRRPQLLREYELWAAVYDAHHVGELSDAGVLVADRLGRTWTGTLEDLIGTAKIIADDGPALRTAPRPASVRLGGTFGRWAAEELTRTDTATSTLTTTDLYDSYAKWCAESALPRVQTQAALVKELVQAGVVVTSRITRGGRRARFVDGVSVRPGEGNLASPLRERKHPAQ